MLSSSRTVIAQVSRRSVSTFGGHTQPLARIQKRDITTPKYNLKGSITPKVISNGVRPNLLLKPVNFGTQYARSYASDCLYSSDCANHIVPDHAEVGLPALSPTMETGNIAKWKKKEGDKIKAGDVIAEIETDKATVDFEATDDAYLAKIVVPEGTKDVPVGQTICVTVENKEDIAAFKSFKVAESPKKDEAPPKEEPKKESQGERPPSQAAPKAPKEEKPKSSPPPSSGVPGAPPPPVKVAGAASPKARSEAAARGIDLPSEGSGPGGRVLFKDLSSAPKAPTTSAPPKVSAPAGGYEDIPNSQIRKVTAQRLTMSKQTIPHYYLSMDCRVDKLLALRAELNGSSEGRFKLSVNDFVIKAAALALKKVPQVNASWNQDSIRLYHSVDINVAVNTDRGLFTPLVADADKLGLGSINALVRDKAEKAKDNKLSMAELTSGSFTISNLGMFGISHFSAVINPPQACILAVGGTQERVVVNEAEGGFKVAPFITVTLSCDHRVVDGAIGAKWLQHFRELMEEPTKMLL